MQAAYDEEQLAYNPLPAEDTYVLHESRTRILSPFRACFLILLGRSISPSTVHYPPSLAHVVSDLPTIRTVHVSDVIYCLMGTAEYASLRGALVDVRFSLRYERNASTGRSGFVPYIERLYRIANFVPPTAFRPLVNPARLEIFTAP